MENLIEKAKRISALAGEEIRPFALDLLTQLQVIAWRLESGENQAEVLKDYYTLMTNLRDSLLSP